MPHDTHSAQSDAASLLSPSLPLLTSQPLQMAPYPLDLFPSHASVRQNHGSVFPTASSTRFYFK